MEISVRKQDILLAVSILERIVGKKESLPVFSCVFIDVKDRCVVRATNLESGVEVFVPCNVKSGGVIAVPVGVFSQTLRFLQGDTLVCKEDNGNLLIQSHGTKTLIKTIPPDDFPLVGFEKTTHKGTAILRSGFIDGLQSVSYAASPSMIRPELGSVFISFKQQGLVCAATDSFRLAEKTIPSIKVAHMPDVLIPLKHITELIHVLERMRDDVVEIATDDSQFIVSTENTRFISRVVDASFPQYHDVIPKESATEAVLLKQDFADMLRKARVFSGSDQQVGFHIYPKRKIFSAIARSDVVGEMSDSLDAALIGEDLTINFNINYLTDCLSSINTDSITLSFSGIGRPLVIRGVSDQTFIYLVMPLNR